MFSSARFTALGLLALAPTALAQPPEAPSTIKKPVQAPVRGFVLPPDPAPISLDALQTLVGGPTLVTFAAPDAPLEDVIKALFEAGKIPQSPTQRFFVGEKKKLSVDWNQTPFWSAAADIEKQMGAQWDTRFGDGLNLQQLSKNLAGGLTGLPGLEAPLVILVANSIERTTTRTAALVDPMAPAAAAPAETDRTQIMLSAYFDPKVSVQSAVLRAVKFQTEGETALLNGTDNRFGYDFGRSPSLITQLTLPIPQKIKPGTKLSRISGTLHTVVVTKTESLSVPDVVATPKISQRIGTGDYALESATVEGDQLSIRLTANQQRAEGQNQMVFYSSNAFQNLSVRDAQGNALPRGGSSSRGGQNSTLDARFQLKNSKGEALPGPYSLSWPITTETRSLDLPFELRDIAVP